MTKLFFLRKLLADRSLAWQDTSFLAMCNRVHVEPCKVQRLLYSYTPPVKYEIKRQLLRVNDLFWMLGLSTLCLDWDAICFLSEKSREKKLSSKQEVGGLLECKCAPGLRLCTPLSEAIMGRKSHHCDSFRETWHLGDNRSVFLQLFNFSAVWNLSRLFFFSPAAKCDLLSHHRTWKRGRALYTPSLCEHYIQPVCAA